MKKYDNKTNTKSVKIKDLKLIDGVDASSLLIIYCDNTYEVIDDVSTITINQYIADELDLSNEN